MSRPHRCCAIGCRAYSPPKYLMCHEHWSLVPHALQAEVNRTLRNRNRRAIDASWGPWWRAAHRAIAEVAICETRLTREQADALVTRSDENASANFR